MRLVDRVLAPLSWLAAALVAVLLFAGPSLIGAKKEQPSAAAAPEATASPAAGSEATAEPEATEAAPEATEAAPEATEAGDSGEAVFADAGCGGCHTLAAAGASGVVGPNLDDAKPDAARVQSIVASGSGSMPAFAGRLSEAEIAAVAKYVADSAGG